MPGLWKRSTERMRRTATEWAGPRKTVGLIPRATDPDRDARLREKLGGDFLSLPDLGDAEATAPVF